MEENPPKLFFSLPPEIRDAIYSQVLVQAVHATLHGGRVVFSACTRPDTTKGLTGQERSPTRGIMPSNCSIQRPAEKIWGRRLCSSWGPHWQCEEIFNARAQKEFDIPGPTMSLLLACRKMFADVARFVTRSSTYYVTDLDTLIHLVQTDDASCSSPPSPHAVFSPLPTSIRKLDITLRLPVRFFEAMASHTRAPDPENDMHELPRAIALLGNWTFTWPALAVRFQQLQHVHIWMDHADRKSWTVADERAVVSSVTASLNPQNLARLDHLVFNLPELHPDFENSELHFTEGSQLPPPFVKIDRRVRQAYLYSDTADGMGMIMYWPDYPYIPFFYVNWGRAGMCRHH